MNPRSSRAAGRLAAAAVLFVASGPWAGGCAVDVPEEGAAVGQVTEALRVCPDGTTTDGIDVSHWQGTIDWDRVAGDGIAFAFIRVSDGTGTRDRTFARNWSEARRVGILRGAYQYFRPNQDPVAQADLLVDALQAASDPGELPPVIDVEEHRGAPSHSEYARRIRQWLDRVEARTGRRGIIYTSPGLWSSLVASPDFAGYGLWVAHWGASCPSVPTGWSQWLFWQTSDSGRVAGIGGRVDTDVFNGDRAALMRLATDVGGGGGGCGAGVPAEPTCDEEPSGSGRYRLWWCAGGSERATPCPYGCVTQPGPDRCADAPDADGDGFAADVDCDDGDPSVHPGAVEVCGDGIDQDCSGADAPCSAGGDGGMEGGVTPADAGRPADAGWDAAVPDAGAVDGGPPPEEDRAAGSRVRELSGGCACSARSGPLPTSWPGALWLLGLLARRRRLRPRVQKSRTSSSDLT